MRASCRTPLGAGRRALVVALIAALTTATTALHAAPPRKNEREMQAREAFAAGRYQEALDVYAKLYAEELHPNYLRNIGRCYQNLDDPEHAIKSFREYERKAKGISAEERAEIDGYIREMEELKRKRASAAAPSKPEPVAREAQPTKPLGPAAPPPREPERPIVTDRPPPPEEAAPVYKRWWFWTLVGGAVAAGAVGVVLARGQKTDLCPANRDCGP